MRNSGARTQDRGRRKGLVENVTPGYESVPPRADAMFEALRAFGYTLESALADLVDNSISAGARNIWIDFNWAGPRSSVTILDNGRGMNENDLREAMRAGTISPLDERRDDDLGRFGLGLKTASLSQCRVLTVRSKTDRAPAATRVWDLDHVGKTREWLLGTEAHPRTRPLLGKLDGVDKGTLVVWEEMDRVVDASGVDDKHAKGRFLARIEVTERHLAMTFHRFLSGRDAISISVNDRPVAPWDPFLEDEPATQELSKEALEIFGRSLHVRPFILPHRSHIGDEVHERAAGPRGWNAQQGFYVYRNRRLIVSGGWLDLGFRQEEHYKLARILVDIPNTMDQEWQLDVKKAEARPPGALLNPMLRIAKVTRARASEVYRHRGRIIKRKHAQEYELVWEKRVRHDRVFYKVNRNHPVVKDALGVPPQARQKVRALLELVENTIPLEAIVVENAENPDSFGQTEEWEFMKNLEQKAMDLFKAFRHEGMGPREAFERVASIEPFDRLPGVLAKIEAQVGGGPHG